MASATSNGACVPPRPGSPQARLAESLIGRPYISHSQVSCFANCPKQFEFRYLIREQPAFVPSSLVFGTSFHAAAAAITAADFEGVERPSVKELVEGVSTELRSSTLPLRFSKGESLESLEGLARRMITAFADSPDSRFEGSVLFLEEAARAEVDPDLPPVEARFDLVYQRPDGGVVIRDVKTSRSRWSQEKLLESRAQLLIYREVVRQVLPEHPAPDRLEYCVISKSARSVVSLHQLEAPRESVGLDEGVLGQLRGFWSSVVAGSFPARPSWQCRSCPYAHRCPEGRQIAQGGGAADDA